MKSYMKLSVLVAGFLTALPSVSHAQVQVKTGAAELKFSGRVQFQLETTTCTEFTPGPASACSSDEAGLEAMVQLAQDSIEG